MNCGQNNAGTMQTSSSTSKLTSQDMMKLFMSIDRSLIREAQIVGKSPTNISELDQVITELMRTDISETDIASIAVGNNFITSPGAVTMDVAMKTKKVLQANAAAVVNVMNLPEKSKVESILKNLRGPVAKIFVYAFIPANSPILKKYPEVSRKRTIQLQTINAIAEGISFPVAYVFKHIRNAIVDHYKTNPEQILHDIANGKDNELQNILPAEGITGLGETDWGGIISAVGGLANTLIQKRNAPTSTDYNPPAPQVVMIPSNQNVTNDPAYNGKDNTLLYVALGVGGLVVVGGGVALAMKK
jgi:hypothetical protein